MPDIDLPDWFDPSKDEAEQVLSVAEWIYTTYPKHAIAFAVAKMVQQQLVHPDLAKINLEMSNEIPLSLFVETMNDRNQSLDALIESLKS